MTDREYPAVRVADKEVCVDYGDFTIHYFLEYGNTVKFEGWLDDGVILLLIDGDEDYVNVKSEIFSEDKYAKLPTLVDTDKPTIKRMRDFTLHVSDKLLSLSNEDLMKEVATVIATHHNWLKDNYKSVPRFKSAVIALGLNIMYKTDVKTNTLFIRVREEQDSSIWADFAYSKFGELKVLRSNFTEPRLTDVKRVMRRGVESVIRIMRERGECPKYSERTGM